VTRRHRRRLYWSAFAVLVASVVLGMFVATRGQLHHPVAVGMIVAVFFGGPVLLVIASIRSMSPGKIYKRLEGRQISGVCRGLAEAWSAPVWVIRMAFVALLFGKGIGLLLYLALDVVLPIHPADRAGLLRFRIARWWRARFA
jgi:phage shock protein PspC (stress-responsive transcriptional regulator)